MFVRGSYRPKHPVRWCKECDIQARQERAIWLLDWCAQRRLPLRIVFLVCAFILLHQRYRVLPDSRFIQRSSIQRFHQCYRLLSDSWFVQRSAIQCLHCTSLKLRACGKLISTLLRKRLLELFFVPKLYRCCVELLRHHLVVRHWLLPNPRFLLRCPFIQRFHRTNLELHCCHQLFSIHPLLRRLMLERDFASLVRACRELLSIHSLLRRVVLGVKRHCAGLFLPDPKRVRVGPMLRQGLRVQHSRHPRIRFRVVVCLASH